MKWLSVALGLPFVLGGCYFLLWFASIFVFGPIVIPLELSRSTGIPYVYMLLAVNLPVVLFAFTFLKWGDDIIDIDIALPSGVVQLIAILMIVEWPDGVRFI